MNVRTLKNKNHVALLRELAEDLGGTFRESYSGRGMFGASCVGIVTDDPSCVIEGATLLGIRRACRDGMGRQTIVYWPHIPAAPSERTTDAGTDTPTQSSGQRTGGGRDV